MQLQGDPISVLLYIFFGMVLSLLGVSFFIILEKSGYKGPSKVFAEKFKRKISQHPEMQGTKIEDELLFVRLEDVDLKKNE